MAIDDTTKKIVQEMLDSGAESISVIHRFLRSHYNYTNCYSLFYRDFKKMEFETPAEFRIGRAHRARRCKILESRNALIFQHPPLSVEEIAEKESEIIGKSITRQGIEYYMKHNGLHKEWHERRSAYLKKQKDEKSENNEQKEELRKSRQDLCDIIVSHYIRRALQEDKPTGFAAWYFYNRDQRQTNISLEKLELFFQNYFEAEKEGITLSLEELSASITIHKVSASRILRDVGLEPLFGSREREVTPKYKKAALKRATELEMNGPDVAYFIDVESYVACHNMRSYGRRKKGYVELMRFQNSERKKEFISYRHASQVYEALDCGFTPQETEQLAEISQRAYKFIMQNRTTIEPVIINALRTIYAAPTHSLPYVTKELKEQLQKQS